MLLVKPYNREKAVEYARRWALSRNPLFSDFTGQGGNCTNFASQCVLAGSCVMNYTPTFGWYYVSSLDRAAAWTGVEFFYNFMTTNDGVGPFMTPVHRRNVVPGDIIQLANDDADYYHTVFVSDVQGSTILVCAHSEDALDRRLSTYDYSFARYLHVIGVNVEYNELGCFDALIEGEGLPERPR